MDCPVEDCPVQVHIRCGTRISADLLAAPSDRKAHHWYSLVRQWELCGPVLAYATWHRILLLDFVLRIWQGLQR